MSLFKLLMATSLGRLVALRSGDYRRLRMFVGTIRVSCAAAKVVGSGILNWGTCDTRKPGKCDQNSKAGRNSNHGESSEVVVTEDFQKACVCVN